MSEFTDGLDLTNPDKDPEDHAAAASIEGVTNGDFGALLETLSDRALAATVANILTAPERGVDMVNLPPHYARFKIEPIRFICENKLDFFQGNVIKYICRHDAKNGPEDIRKVIRYAFMYYRFLKGDPEWSLKASHEDVAKVMNGED